MVLVKPGRRDNYVSHSSRLSNVRLSNDDQGDEVGEDNALLENEIESYLFRIVYLLNLWLAGVLPPFPMQSE